MEVQNVLSLFGGIECAKVALDRGGINYNHYFSCEINKYAIKIAKKNHPDIIHLGDVTKLKGCELPQIDLIIAGSPCQGFSFSGKQLNFEDPRSKLFFEVPRLIKECKPKYFLLENVVMKQEYQDVISEYLGVQPVMINSALVSAQSRKRLYWTNIGHIPQPKDKKIYLKDIIQSEVVDQKLVVYDEPKRIATIGNGGQGQRIYSINGKSITLTAHGGGGGAKTGYYAIAQRGRNVIDGKKADIKGAKTQQRFETSFSEKSNCLTSVQKDSLLLKLLKQGYIIRKLTPNECEILQTLTPNYCEGISNTQQHICLGNCFTVDVIAHILRCYE